jgi:hypothetical protein
VLSIPRSAATYLELAVDLVAEGAEQLLPVRLGVRAADRAALRRVAVGQDGDDQLLVGAPTCDRSKTRSASVVGACSAARARARNAVGVGVGPSKALWSCSASSATAGTEEGTVRVAIASVRGRVSIGGIWEWDVGRGVGDMSGDRGARGEQTPGGEARGLCVGCGGVSGECLALPIGVGASRPASEGHAEVGKWRSGWRLGPATRTYVSMALHYFGATTAAGPATTSGYRRAVMLMVWHSAGTEQ